MSQGVGLASCLPKTAWPPTSGYLTRRLVDIAQDLIINEHDCNTEDGIWIRKSDDVAGQKMDTRLYGRLVAQRVDNPLTGEVLVERNEMLDHDRVRKVVTAGIEAVKVRSPLTCELVHGICSKCYGMDLGRGEMVTLGAAVGIVAAQSIGEKSDRSHVVL